MAKKSVPPRGPQLKLAGDLSVAFVNTAAALAAPDADSPKQISGARWAPAGNAAVKS